MNLQGTNFDDLNLLYVQRGLLIKFRMLEFAAVITTGGILLFSNVFNIDNTIFLSLVNRIIDSKNLEANFIIQTLQINYLYDAILGLIFVIAWRKEIALDYPSKLLQAMSLEWKAVYN